MLQKMSGEYADRDCFRYKRLSPGRRCRFPQPHGIPQLVLALLGEMETAVVAYWQ
jgi:hypothetical protein